MSRSAVAIEVSSSTMRPPRSSPGMPSPVQQWQESVYECNCMPVAVLEANSRSVAGTAKKKEEEVSKEEDPSQSVLIDDGLTSPLKSSYETRFERLYHSPVGHVRSRDVDRGLIPSLSTTPSDKERKLAELDRTNGQRVRGIKCAHEYRVMQSPNNMQMTRYRAGQQVEEAPLRVVTHERKGFPFVKKNPEISPHGISRNVLGGFYCT